VYAEGFVAVGIGQCVALMEEDMQTNVNLTPPHVEEESESDLSHVMFHENFHMKNLHLFT
jgi:hypothetical protein